jgi:hypothetical protein
VIIAVRTSPGVGHLPRLLYSLDNETGILAARLTRPGGSDPEQMARPAPCPPEEIVQVAGLDGSWLHFEVRDGRLDALEIAIWPDLGPASRIALPVADGFADVSLAAVPRSRGRKRKKRSLAGVTVPLRALPDREARTIQLFFGHARRQRAVRVADNLFVGADDAGRLASIWLMNVPGLAPSPG